MALPKHSYSVLHRAKERWLYLRSIGIYTRHKTKLLKQYGLDRDRLGTLDELVWRVRVREMQRNQRQITGEV